MLGSSSILAAAHSHKTVSIGLDGKSIKGLLKGAIVRGIEPTSILLQAGIEPSVLGNLNASIDGRDLVKLIVAAQEAIDDVYLGFLAQTCRPALEAERLRLMTQSETLGEVIRTSCRFSEATSADIGLGIREIHNTFGSVLQVIYEYQTTDQFDEDLLVWVRFLTSRLFLSWLIDQPLVFSGVSTRSPKNVQSNGFERYAVFGCPVEYGSEVNALYFKKNVLSPKIRKKAPIEFSKYLVSGVDLFSPMKQEETVTYRTEQVLWNLQKISKWHASLAEVASLLGVEPRRLRRDLAQEGEGFLAIRTRLRHELASAYLLATDLPLKSISWKLGYSEPASFTRSFQMWSGSPPKTYREQYQRDKDRISAAAMLLAGLVSD